MKIVKCRMVFFTNKSHKFTIKSYSRLNIKFLRRNSWRKTPIHEGLNWRHLQIIKLNNSLYRCTSYSIHDFHSTEKNRVGLFSYPLLEYATWISWYILIYNDWRRMKRFRKKIYCSIEYYIMFQCGIQYITCICANNEFKLNLGLGRFYTNNMVHDNV